MHYDKLTVLSIEIWMERSSALCFSKMLLSCNLAINNPNKDLSLYGSASFTPILNLVSDRILSSWYRFLRFCNFASSFLLLSNYNNELYFKCKIAIPLNT